MVSANTNTDLTWGSAKWIDDTYLVDPAPEVYSFYGEICYALPCAVSALSAAPKAHV
jgi:hypothetical protein